MKRTLSPARRARRWLLLAVTACLPACTWLEGEFTALDRLPPSVRDAGAPLSALAEQP